MTPEYRLHPFSTGKFKIAYEQELNPAQLEAVLTLDGPLLCLAGAGSGKTRTLVYRVARMIESGIPPESILLLTFTRKASGEMLKRSGALVGTGSGRVTGGTYHSVSNLVLRRFGRHLGLPSTFSILDEGDSSDILGILRTDLGLHQKETRFPLKATLKEMHSASINRSKPLEELVKQEYQQFIEHFEDIERLFKGYEEYKRANHLLDYDDLLLRLIDLLESAPEAKQALNRQFRYLMVDEYQDTNSLQARITGLLAGEDRNIMAVGDDAQSIYSFRGADFRNILRFPEQFPGCKIIKLEQNYRSTEPILNATNHLMKQAKSGFAKDLFTRESGGDKPAVFACADEDQQSRFIAQRVLELREEGIALDRIAVLFRSGFHAFSLELELRRRNIPYQKWGGFKFLDASHIKDILAHLRILLNPLDQVSWNRLLLLLDGVGPKGVAKVWEEIRRAPNPFALADFPFKGRLQESVQPLAELLRKLTVEPRPEPSDLIGLITDYYGPILKHRYEDHLKRIKDLDQLAVLAGKYRSLEELLTDFALEPPTNSIDEHLADDGDREPRLVLSTVHSAKGLEWHSVFVIWTLEGRFPSFGAMHDAESLEEERRLMYVAMTRAQRFLYLTHPASFWDPVSGALLAEPSRFLREIGTDLLERWTIRG